MGDYLQIYLEVGINGIFEEKFLAVDWLNKNISPAI